jgi:hypothetical protein
MTERPELEEMINSIPCDFCHQPAGEHCIRPRTGKRYPWPHALRYHAAQQAGIIRRWRELHDEWLASL